MRPRRARRDPLGARPKSSRATDLPGRVRLLFQPAEETVPGGAFGVLESGCSTASRRSTRCTATPGCRPARSACASVRSPRRATRWTSAVGTGRPHVPPAPHGRSGVRAGAHHDRVARAAVAPRRPPRGHVAGLGLGRRRPRRERHPDRRARCAARCGCSTARRGEGRGPGARADRADRRPDRRRAPRSSTAAGCRRSSTMPRAVAVQRAAVFIALGPAALVDTEQSMGGEDFGWYLTRHPRRARAARCARRPAARASTCTRARSTSTSRPSRSACATPSPSPARRSPTREPLTRRQSPSDRQGRLRSSSTYSSGAPAACGRLGDQAEIARRRQAALVPVQDVDPGQHVTVERRDPQVDLVVQPGVRALPVVEDGARRAARCRRARRTPGAGVGHDGRERAVPAEFLAAEGQPPAVEPADAGGRGMRAAFEHLLRVHVGPVCRIQPTRR